MATKKPKSRKLTTEQKLRANIEELEKVSRKQMVEINEHNKFLADIRDAVREIDKDFDYYDYIELVRTVKKLMNQISYNQGREIGAKEMVNGAIREKMSVLSRENKLLRHFVGVALKDPIITAKAKIIESGKGEENRSSHAALEIYRDEITHDFHNDSIHR